MLCLTNQTARGARLLRVRLRTTLAPELDNASVGKRYH